MKNGILFAVMLVIELATGLFPLPIVTASTLIGFMLGRMFKEFGDLYSVLYGEKGHGETRSISKINQEGL